MKWFGLTLLFVVTTLTTALANMPMQAALSASKAEQRGLRYSNAYGTVWKGGVTNASFLGQELGLIDLKVHPVSVVKGRVEAKFSISGEAGNARGTASSSLNIIRVENLVADINVQKLIHLDPRLRQIPSTLNLSVIEASINHQGACEEMRSRIETDLLKAVGRQWQWTGSQLSGQIICENGRPAVSLENTEGPDDIAASVVLNDNNQFVTQASVNTQNGRLEQALLALGFVFERGAYKYENVAGPTGTPITSSSEAG